MMYKTKVLALSITAIVLALIYAGSFVFSPEMRGARSASYSWIDEKVLPQAGRIEIEGLSGDTALSRVNGLWVISKDGGDYPVKQDRVDDFLRLLSERKAYPVRAQAESSYQRLGVGEDAVSRVIIRGAAGPAGAEKPPLLDLLIGDSDAAGREVYLRKSGAKEVRSGDSGIKSYVNSASSSWYNLLLFGGRTITVDAVQRVTVVTPPKGGEGEEGSKSDEFTLVRDAGGWSLLAGGEALDSQKVESYIRGILEAEGEGFNSALQAADGVFNEGRVVLELGDGSSRTIRVGPKSAAGKRDAAVSGSPFAFTLAEWTVNRLFRAPGEFARAAE